MDKPNVLLICVDQWPGTLMGAAGHPCILTPTLDQLCENGVRFSRAYSAHPTCVPARRTLMTGTTARTHGDRVYDESLPMPDVPTLAQCFRDAGYQAYAVGKLHVNPQRNRIGFDDVLVNEEGRHHWGLLADDYELFLADQGYAGQEKIHGMCNNEYTVRPWHLPEYCHETNWTVREMCRFIKRRDPTRPAFWYMSFNYPHPPIVPLQCYLDMYREIDVDSPVIGDWAQDVEQLPYALRPTRSRGERLTDTEVRMARQGFYAQCTHIDHQMRLVIGMLREEGLLDDTIVMFVCDHGDMLGDHRQWAKRIFLEKSAHIPFILVPTAAYERVGHHVTDDRLAELRDVMPTLLDLCGIPIPETVEGMSLVGDHRREYLYGEHSDGAHANRMVHDGRHKLIYYPAGNHVHLFDLEQDPTEEHNVADDPAYAEVRARLIGWLIENLYGGDEAWARDGDLVGIPEPAFSERPNRGLSSQRGWRFM